MPTKIFLNNKVNPSVQIGDMAYVANVGPGGVTTTPQSLGEIINLNSGYITVNKDASWLNINFPLGISGMFLLFAKRIEANESSLKGYYADVTFQNYSNGYVELFAVSSDIALSSK